MMKIKSWNPAFNTYSIYRRMMNVVRSSTLKNFFPKLEPLAEEDIKSIILRIK